MLVGENLPKPDTLPTPSSRFSRYILKKKNHLIPRCFGYTHPASYTVYVPHVLCTMSFYVMHFCLLALNSPTVILSSLALRARFCPIFFRFSLSRFLALLPSLKVTVSVWMLLLPTKCVSECTRHVAS